MKKTVTLLCGTLLALAAMPAVSPAQATTGKILEEVVPPGRNFDKAEFRFWYPDGTAPLQGVIALMPGSNGDGRPAAQDTAWQAFAAAHKLALIAAHLTDKTHDLGFIEEYVDVSKGSGQAFLDALGAFATRSGHPEVATAPLLLWGMSAGGQFNYEFVAWKPERVMAFVVNKGGIYYTALAQRAAREVPGILFVGGKDLEFRTNTIVGLFAVNRRAGALWALAEEPGAAHIVGRSRDVAVAFFEDVLAARGGGSSMKPLAAGAGFIGDLKTGSYQPVGDSRAPAVPTSWLPTPRVARMWQAMVTDKPFEK